MIITLIHVASSLWRPEDSPCVFEVLPEPVHVLQSGELGSKAFVAFGKFKPNLSRRVYQIPRD